MKPKILLVAVAALLCGAAASADEQTETLARQALDALNGSLSREFGREMSGRVMYQERQSVAVVVAIDYPLDAGADADQWPHKVGQALRMMGTKRVAEQRREVRGEQVPIGDSQPVAQFTASDEVLSAVVIFLLQ